MGRNKRAVGLRKILTTLSCTGQPFAPWRGCKGSGGGFVHVGTLAVPNGRGTRRKFSEKNADGSKIEAADEL